MRYIETYKDLIYIIKNTGIKIRHENPPEDVTENIVKFIIRNHGDDKSCVWCKSIKKSGDIWSEKYKCPEIKSFTSEGPSSFGPTKEFDVIYFLDIRGLLKDKIILWRVNLTNESTEWKNVKVNDNETFEDHCKSKRRPRITWSKLYLQISKHCDKIFEGKFEDIFVE